MADLAVTYTLVATFFKIENELLDIFFENSTLHEKIFYIVAITHK